MTTRRPLATAVALLSVPLGAVGLGACSLPDEGIEAGSCSDRIDNDGDYYFDCGDPGCAGSPDCADAGTTEPEPTDSAEPEDSGTPTSADCRDNTYTLTFEDDTTLVLDAWIWREGWGGAHLVGFASEGRDACAIAEELFSTGDGYDGYFFQIDLPAVPEAGDIPRIQASSGPPNDGTARIENLSTLHLETSEDGGRMQVRSVALDGLFAADDVYARMSGGTAPQGDLVACWCDATPIGPEPD